VALLMLNALLYKRYLGISRVFKTANEFKALVLYHVNPINQSEIARAKRKKKKRDWKWMVNKIQNIAKQGRLKVIFYRCNINMRSIE
jgi:hypothetical protein